MHLLVAAYLDHKPAPEEAVKTGDAAVQELSQVLPIAPRGPRLDTSAWDARAQASEPLEVTSHG